MKEKKLRKKLYNLGYLQWDDSDLTGALRLFQENHGAVYGTAGIEVYGRPARIDGKWGPATEALLNIPRDCGCPDIQRDPGNRKIVAEARWPNECSTNIEFSHEFKRAPGLSETQTRQGIGIALAEWNVAFQSPQSGQMYQEYLDEIRRVLPEVPTSRMRNFVLWVGTVKHEVGHALGLNHTPGDPNSVMYPSMRGQWLLNPTDVNNLSRNQYKAGNIKLKIVDWKGPRETRIWARLKALPGGTLAWSFLSNGSCSQRAEQAYDNTVTWSSGAIIDIPEIDKPKPPEPPKPPGPGPGPDKEFLDNLNELHFVARDGSLMGKTRTIRLTF